ncbi:hypothetical protein AOLI_G00219340 [Acnodon oligacanthus]
MWAAVNIHTTFSLASSIYEDVLIKMNSALLETDVFTGEDSFVEEATTVLTEDQTQNQPLPTEKPSNAPTSSAAIPKRKTFFSRVSAAFCRIFRKRAKTSS